MPKQFASLYFVVALEKEFQMHITDEEAANVTTVAQLFDYVITRTSDTTRTGTATWNRFCDLMVEHMDVARERITPDSALQL
jgi:hypothetical protein